MSVIGSYLSKQLLGHFNKSDLGKYSVYEYCVR